MIEDLLQTETATLSVFSRSDGPLILLNATDLVSGQVFTFDPNTLDDICMDYNRVPAVPGRHRVGRLSPSPLHPSFCTTTPICHRVVLDNGTCICPIRLSCRTLLVLTLIR